MCVFQCTFFPHPLMHDDAKLLFNSEGEYTINVFTEKQLVANGTLIKLIYNNGSYLYYTKVIRISRDCLF